MTASVSLTDLRTRVRYYANMEASTFVTDTELNARISASARRLYGKLVATRGQEYYRVNGTLTTTPGVALYALPDGFWQMLVVMAQWNGLWLRMQPFETNEEPELLNIKNPVPGVIRYRLTGQQQDAITAEQDKLELCPTPVSAFTIRFLFIPTLTLTPDGLGETWVNGVAGFEEWIVLDVAIQCLAKEESDASALMQLKAECERDIESLAGARDAGAAARVVDVRADLGRLSPWRMPPRWGGLP